MIWPTPKLCFPTMIICWTNKSMIYEKRWRYACFCEMIIHDFGMLWKKSINAIVKGFLNDHDCERFSHQCWIMFKELLYALILKCVDWYWWLSFPTLNWYLTFINFVRIDLEPRGHWGGDSNRVSSSNL